MESQVSRIFFLLLCHVCYFTFTFSEFHLYLSPMRRSFSNPSHKRCLYYLGASQYC